MPIKFLCDHCGQRLSIGTRMSGRQVHCPKCQAEILVPHRSRGQAAQSPPHRSPPHTPPGKPRPEPPTPQPRSFPPPIEADEKAWDQQPPEPSADEAKTPATPAETPAAPVEDRPAESPTSPPVVEPSVGPPAASVGPPEEADPPPKADGGDGDAGEDASQSDDSELPRSTSSPDRSGQRFSLETPRFDAERLASWSPVPRPQIVPGAPSIVDPAADQTEWVYEDEEEYDEPEPDPDYVAVPRRVLYAVGGLLGLVGVGCFVLGMLFGGSAQPEESAAGPQPCQIDGEVLFARGSEAPAADDGATVLIVPRDQRPDRQERIACEGLGPLQQPPAANDDAVQAIRRLGGDYARTDRQGRYRLRAPDRGRYFLLVISANRTLDSGEEMSRSDLSEIGAYFRPATELLGDQKFQWRVLRVQEDRRVDVVF